MERTEFVMRSLFDQLGQASDHDSIQRFIDSRRPLAGDVRLHEAPFWTTSQAAFLREAILDDAEWAVVVEALNGELHRRGMSALATSTTAVRPLA